MKHNFDDAIAELPTGDDFNNHVGHESSDYLYVYSDTIKFALKFTKAALSGEVSETARVVLQEAGYADLDERTKAMIERDLCIDFKAMSQQLAKEIG